MIFANKIKHLLLGTLIPLFAASTLVLTGFSLWQFDINIEKNIYFYSQSVVVNPYVDGDYGIITTAQNNVLYPNQWRLTFEEGVEEDIYDNTTGINFTPDIDVNIKITMDGYAIETFRLEIKTEIISDNCSVNLNDYIYPSGFMVSGVNARFPNYYELSSAEETLNIFVPLAYFIGAFKLKCELEDICLSYLDNEAYNTLTEKEEDILKDYDKCRTIASKEVEELLKANNIQFTYRIKILNVYHLYRKLNKGYKLNDIHDLVNFKLILADDEDPYRVLGLIHKLYTPMNNKFKDYIACPKTNMYRSLHTTVFGPDNHLLQFQIKTKTMDDINTIGLAAYWKYFKAEGKTKMQHELKLNYQFFNTLRDLNDVIDNDSDYIDRVKQEIFSNNIYVYTLRGDIIELPNGSTVIDFAYKIHTDIGNHLYKAYINGKEVKLTHKLNNKDRIMLIQREKSTPHKSWLDHAVTSSARRKIKDALKK